MAQDGFVEVPPDSTGKKIDSEDRINFAGVEVQRQRIAIPDGVLVSGDALDRIWTEQRVQNLLLAHAFGINDDLNTLSDLASGGFGGPLSQLICPLIIGGVGSPSTLTLESTSAPSGIGDFINFKTGAQVEALRIDSNGNVNIGNAGPMVPDVFGGEKFQVNGNINISRYSNDIFSGALTFSKSRGTAVGNNTTVQSGDSLSDISSAGYDATATPVLREAVSITSSADAAPTAGTVSGRLSFNTANSGTGGFAQERLRIDSAGRVNIGNNGASIDTASQLEISTDTSVLGDALTLNGYNSFAPFVFFNKTNGSTPSTQTTVTSGQKLFELCFTGSDGTAYRKSSSIQVFADAAPATSTTPGQIRFNTAPAGTSQTPLERLRIDSNGFLTTGGFAAPPGLFSDNATLTIPLATSTQYAWSVATYGLSTTNSTAVSFWRTNGASPTTQSAVASGNRIFSMDFGGSDGTNLQASGSIQGFVDGSVSAGVVPFRLIFNTGSSGGGSERLRIDSNGNVTIGGFANLSVASSQALFQTIQTGTVWDTAFVTYGNNSNLGGSISAKTRGSTPTTQAIVSLNDQLSFFAAYGSDGAAFQRGGSLEFDVDVTPAANSMPTRFVLKTTANLQTTPAERMRIDSNGWFYTANSNVGSLFPALSTTGPSGATPNAVAVGWNKTNGNRDIALINLDATPAPQSFTFWQMTGASAISALMSINTLGFGYFGGFSIGGGVTQGTSRTTGVTLNKACGAITLFAAAPTVGTWVTFTVTNSNVVATDTIIVCFKSGTNTYVACVSAVGSGSFNISFMSISGTTSDSPVINFAVIKAASS